MPTPDNNYKLQITLLFVVVGICVLAFIAIGLTFNEPK